MDPTRFDTVTRLLGRQTSRRKTISAAATVLAGASLMTTNQVAAQQATPVASAAEEDFPEFLFTQSFHSGTWGPKEGEEGVYTLTLSNVPPQILYFSDRPERIFGTLPTQQFLDGLGFTPVNPPNAALVAQIGPDSAEQEVLVIELLNPVYDLDTATMTYDAVVLADYSGTGLDHAAQHQQDDSLPAEFAHGSLFIDDCSDGHAVCYYEEDGEKVIAGTITNVGCCFSWSAGHCEACNDDARSEYYGQLCNESFPDSCFYGEIDGGGIGWSCYADAVTCQLT